MKWIEPVKLLLFGGIASTLMTIIVVIGAGTEWLLLSALILISSFMSLMFPTIYGLALGDITRGAYPSDAKIGASCLIMAILGGALITPIQGIVSDSSTIYISYIVPTICFAIVSLYALYALRNTNKIN